jgi:hypothetical protein
VKNGRLQSPQGEGAEWQRFIADWWEVHRDNWTAANALVEIALKSGRLCNLLGEGSRRSQQSRLGRALVAKGGQRFGPWQISTQRDPHRKSMCYRLVPANADRSNSSQPRLADLLTAWWRRFGGQWVTVYDLLPMVTGKSRLFDQPEHSGFRAVRGALARMLYALRGSCVDGWCIEWSAGSGGMPQRFRLHPVEGRCPA